jgi:very-short-patch-repair endonuclease
MDKLIIEFDGDYWHNKPDAILNDKLKDEIAIEEGFNIFRIKYSERLDPNKIIEITDKLKEIKTNEIQVKINH